MQRIEKIVGVFLIVFVSFAGGAIFESVRPQEAYADEPGVENPTPPEPRTPWTHVTWGEFDRLAARVARLEQDANRIPPEPIDYELTITARDGEFTYTWRAAQRPSWTELQRAGVYLIREGVKQWEESSKYPPPPSEAEDTQSYVIE